MSKSERADYDAYMDMLQYNQSSFRTAVETAEYEGEKRGEAAGLEKGKAEGELKAKLETARQMLADGVAVDNVARWTGLLVAEVKKIAKK